MLVDDDADALTIFRLAFAKAGILEPLITAPGGPEAISYLSDASKPPPCLLITDLKMPGMDGFELIERVKSLSPPPEYPVVVLTSSELQSDKHRAYETGAVDYYIKPLGLAQTAEMLKKIRNKWLNGALEP